MKKVLLYTLLFLLLTIVVFFTLIFTVPYIVWSFTENGGQENNVFDAYPLLLPSLAVSVWAILTLFIFIRNKYADISFGNIAKDDRLKVCIISAISVVLFKIALQPLMWITDSEISETHYSIVQMWMNNDLLVVALLSLIHITLETVVFSAILRELIQWSNRPYVSIFVVALACTIPSMTELTAIATLPLLCSFLPIVYGGWIYYRTSSIWPVFIGMTVYDAVLFFTPVSEYITSALVAALVLPWVVIYLSKHLTADVEPITSR